MANDLHTLIESYCNQTGGVISALRAIVARQGHIDNEAAQLVAGVFNISHAEVRGIVSFYSDLRTISPGRHIVKVCQAEACQAVGGRELTRQVLAAAETSLGETTPDGELTIEPVYCLGLCTNGPAAMLDDELISRADLSLPQLIAGLKSE